MGRIHLGGELANFSLFLDKKSSTGAESLLFKFLIAHSFLTFTPSCVFDNDKEIDEHDSASRLISFSGRGGQKLMSYSFGNSPLLRLSLCVATGEKCVSDEVTFYLCRAIRLSFRVYIRYHQKVTAGAISLKHDDRGILPKSVGRIQFWLKSGETDTSARTRACPFFPMCYRHAGSSSQMRVTNDGPRERFCEI